MNTLTEQIFNSLIKDASLAPSADNMQPWEFRKSNDAIEVCCAPERFLPTDVNSMFSWISIGAAIQNIVIAAEEYGLKAGVKYCPGNDKNDSAIALISFSSNGIKEDGVKKENSLAKFIGLRNTNRNPYKTEPVEAGIIEKLTASVKEFNSCIHWTNSQSDFEKMAYMDAHSSYIRLEHKPLHDELFSILRFTKNDIEHTRFGLTFESLDVPKFAVFFARQLQYWSVNQVISNLGFGRLVAKQLSGKLRKTGAICLLTVPERKRTSYLEAGRALEQLWLTAASLGLSVQPYGVLPQYLTKVELEPETFLPRYVQAIEKHRETFYSIFPKARNEFPAIVLRLGFADKQSARSDVRLTAEQLIRSHL